MESPARAAVGSGRADIGSGPAVESPARAAIGSAFRVKSPAPAAVGSAFRVKRWGPADKRSALRVKRSGSADKRSALRVKRSARRAKGFFSAWLISSELSEIGRPVRQVGARVAATCWQSTTKGIHDPWPSLPPPQDLRLHRRGQPARQQRGHHHPARGLRPAASRAGESRPPGQSRSARWRVISARERSRKSAPSAPPDIHTRPLKIPCQSKGSAQGPQKGFSGYHSGRRYEEILFAR